MILVLVLAIHNMIWHIKILHNAQVSQRLEQKSDSFTDKSFRAHTRRTMHTTIGEGDETHTLAYIHIQQSNTHTKSVTQCTRRYSRTITQGVEITATQGTEVNICTKSQKATRSRIKRGSATASKGELGEITGRRWGGNFRLKTGKQSTIKACS